MVQMHGRVRVPRLSAYFFPALCVLGNAACGGGGGGGSTASAPTVTLSVQPTTITVGQSATLTWSTSGASTCAASGAWSGSEALSGTDVVTPPAAGTLTYALSCTAPAGSGYAGGGGGTTTMSVTLTVNAASAFTASTLVSDTTGGGGMTIDPNLVNPWGIVFGAGQPVWVVNNHTQTSTLYDGNGKPRPLANPLVVHLPGGAGSVTFDPTGVVSNDTTDFVVSDSGSSDVARYIFAGEGGMLAGWSSRINRGNPVTVYADVNGAVYKGLAIASSGSANFLYAVDFHNNKIDVFDARFAKQPSSVTSFAFGDPTLPAGYAPFGIQAIKNGAGGATQLYVTYAKQLPPENHDNASGAGTGLVDAFDANGNLLKHLIPVGGALDAPWGMALAPGDFGTLSNALLIGNFGDGKINGYDPASGQFIASLTVVGGSPFSVPGLWGIAFGNDEPDSNQPHNTLFYAAGTNDEANGLYGRIDLAK